MSSFQGVEIERFHYVQRCLHFRVLGWMYTEVLSFQGFGIEGFHYKWRCPHFMGLESTILLVECARFPGVGSLYICHRPYFLRMSTMPIFHLTSHPSLLCSLQIFCPPCGRNQLQFSFANHNSPNLNTTVGMGTLPLGGVVKWRWMTFPPITHK